MNNPVLDLIVEKIDGETPMQFEVKTLAHAMYCSRGLKSEQLADHIPDKVRQLGLPSVPVKIPAFCQVSRYLLTSGQEIEVQSDFTCGEVEVVALIQGENIFIGLGSDHCDRAIEPYFYYKPKQMAPRVLAPRVWRYADVQDHWDQLQLKSTIVVNGVHVPFQDGTLGQLLPLKELLESAAYDPDGLVLYCGTVSIAQYIYGQEFLFEVFDPVLGRCLRHGYSICVLNNLQ